jgi:tetratricopeptide (TPR) repeat protein
MAIKGSLKEASLPDVLQLLALGRKTGCLAVADKQNFGYIYFDEGRINYASIVNRRDRLGDILVKNGKITADQLTEAIKKQEDQRDQKLGEILVMIGAISRPDLEEYMRVQIEEAVYFLFTWTSGTFNFEAGVKPERQDFLVKINPESLLLEGARRVDEWSLIEKKIPSFDLIFTVDQQHLTDAGVQLSMEQERVVPLLDGKRDIHQLVEDSGLVEFDVGKALYGLITAGFAHRSGSSALSPEPKVNAARIEEHRNLGIAFFKTGMLDEAQREFRRVADLRPTEASAPFFIGIIALRQAKWADAVESLKLAGERGGPRPAVLANLAFGMEQMGRIADAEACYGEAVSRSREEPRLMTGWAIAALKKGDAHVAVGRLQRARELYGAKPVLAVWFWAMALAQALDSDLESALRTAEEGIQKYPTHPVLRNNYGVLLELMGDLERSEQVVRDALKDDPSLPQLSKNLGDLCYRGGKYEEAADAYGRAAKLAPELGDDLYFKLGNIAFRQRDIATARENWKRVLQLNPGHQLARTNLESLDTSGVG